MKTNVGVIFGGRSVEQEVSVISAIQCIQNMDTSKYDVTPIYITKDGIWYTGKQLAEIENYKNISKLLSKCDKILISPNASEYNLFSHSPGIFTRNVINIIDVAFPIVHGTHMEDGCLQGLLELMNIPYVGCDVLSSALGMDKVMQKMILKAHGIPVLDCLSFHSSRWLSDSQKVLERLENKIKYPAIVKPVNLGSSIGITPAKNREELEEAIEVAVGLSSQVLVEPLIKNLLEINCAVLGDQDYAEVSLCEEPITVSDILSFQDKYLGSGKTKGMSAAKRRLPADIPEEMSYKIQELAKKAFFALNLSGVSRMDFLINKDNNNIYFNEPNTIPGSLAFYLWEPSGKPYPKLIDQLIELAFKRFKEKNNLIFSYESSILEEGAQGLKGGKGGKIGKI